MLVLAASYGVLPLLTSYPVMAVVLVGFIAVPTGIFYTISAICAIKYFPIASAKVNALQQFGQGIGCVLISYATFWGCNPDNRPVDMHPNWMYNLNSFQVQGTFTAVAIMLMMSAVFVWLYIRYPKGRPLVMERSTASCCWTTKSTLRSTVTNSKAGRFLPVDPPQRPTSRMCHLRPA